MVEDVAQIFWITVPSWKEGREKQPNRGSNVGFKMPQYSTKYEPFWCYPISKQKLFIPELSNHLDMINSQIIRLGMWLLQHQIYPMLHHKLAIPSYKAPCEVYPSQFWDGTGICVQLSPWRGNNQRPWKKIQSRFSVTKVKHSYMRTKICLESQEHTHIIYKSLSLSLSLKIKI